METRQFHITTVFSVVTFRFVTPLHPKYIGKPDGESVEEIYEILSFMAGESISTHQLKRFADECLPYFPEFTRNWRAHANDAISIANGDPDEITRCLKQLLGDLTAQHGEWIAVQRIPMDDHTLLDPIEEFKQQFPGTEVVEVVLDEEEPPISPIGDINWKVED